MSDSTQHGVCQQGTCAQCDRACPHCGGAPASAPVADFVAHPAANAPVVGSIVHYVSGWGKGRCLAAIVTFVPPPEGTGDESVKEARLSVFFYRGNEQCWCDHAPAVPGKEFKEGSWHWPWQCQYERNATGDETRR